MLGSKSKWHIYRQGKDHYLFFKIKEFHFSMIMSNPSTGMAY